MSLKEKRKAAKEQTEEIKGTIILPETTQTSTEEVPEEITEEQPRPDNSATVKAYTDKETEDHNRSWTSLSFIEAVKYAIEHKKDITLPEWKGFWRPTKMVGGTHYFKVHTKEGQILDTPIIEYMFRNDWQIIDR